MNLIDGIKSKNYIENTKGGKYYSSTYNKNLDVFSMLSRYNPSDEIIRMFNNAVLEDEDLALANLLYILDIRNGKGERLLFKTIFKDLCLNNPALAVRVLPFIGELGRYDYILEGLKTPVEDKVIKLIKDTLEVDLKSDKPSLLAKWLPSHRTHGKNNELAKIIWKKLGITEKEYRVTLAKLRSKINIIEKNLTNGDYGRIDFKEVPTKAFLRYNYVFQEKMSKEYEDYKKLVQTGKEKINTNGLYVYEIIKKILWEIPIDDELFDLMWKNQKDLLKDVNSNILVIADTSASMESYGYIPLATSIGLAIYTAERNNGIFKNHFITFSDNPLLEEVVGNTIKEKVQNVKTYIGCTDIDKVFELILNVALENKLKQEDLPSHLLIISDMEFDAGVKSQHGTNFETWKKSFNEKGYKLPNIIFWNVAGFTQGVPVTKFTQDVALVSGFSTNILENIFNLEHYNPQDFMLEKLSIYLEMLGVNHG